MRLMINIFILTTCFGNGIFAQKVQDILDNGNIVKSDNYVIVRYNKHTKDLKFKTNTKKKTLYNPIEDSSALFLFVGRHANVFMKPLNPLTHSYKVKESFIVDPINEEALTALGSITETVGTILGSQMPSRPTCTTIVDSMVGNIQKLLVDNKISVDSVNHFFSRLTQLSFKKKKETINKLSEIQQEIKVIDKHFQMLDQELELLEKYIKDSCEIIRKNNVPRYIYALIIKDIKSGKQAKYNYYFNVVNAIKIVEDAIEEATKTPGVKWGICLTNDLIPKNKILHLKIDIYSSGYMIKGGKIVKTESKILKTRTLKLRRFQTFVPEVSTGVALTSFEYPVFGIETDSLGQQFVAYVKDEVWRNINFSVMINFNLYIQNSHIHPFWQIGIGANSEVPTLLTGIGIRSNVGVQRLAISGGFAFSFIKELDQLEVGDKVSGTTDLEDDLKYQLSWPPRFYVGIQYNF